MRHRLALSLALGALLALAPAASAHRHAEVPAGHTRHETRHGDRIPPGADALLRRTLRRRALARVAAFTAAPSLASSWCGTETSSDDTVHQAVDGATIKVVYAHPSDVPDRFAAYADLIQGDLRGVDDAYSSSSNAAKLVRFDVGTACGANYVDITSVALPRTRAAYLSGTLDDRVTAVRADVRSALSGLNGTRDVLVYADGLYGGDGVTGVAERPTDSSAGATNAANGGGFFAFVLGNGSASFGISHLTTAEHELTHTLGGVQDDAPHTSGGGHCWDAVDVMCYDDGGANIPASGLEQDCPGAAPTTLDCGHDDYFSPAPAAGSYLATHWNLYDSAFLCAPASCFGQGNLAPSAAFTVSPSSPQAGRAVTFDGSASSDPDGSVAGWSWDVDGDGVADGSGPRLTWTYPRAGTYAVRLTVTDAAGATGTTTRTVRVVVPPPPPPPQTKPPAPRPPTPRRPTPRPHARPGRALGATRKALRRSLHDIGGVRGLARGRVLRASFAPPSAGRLTARLQVGERPVATAIVAARPGHPATLRLRVGSAARARLRGAPDSALHVRLAFASG